MISAVTSIQIQFYDLDALAVVWHGNYVRFLEQARCSLLEKIGFSYVAMARTDYIWPVVDLRIKYVQPIRFGQVIDVTATLVEYENRLSIDYVIRSESGEVLTKARTIQVAVQKNSKETMLESPPELLAAIERAVTA